MTPDHHNQAVKNTYPVGGQISIDSRVHSPFPLLAEIIGYDYAPTGRVLLRLKHAGPRHWNQPKEFVFDPEIETVAHQKVKSLPLTELDQQNVAVLRTFRLHDNITVRASSGAALLRLGHVDGFVYDDKGKIFIRVQFIAHFSAFSTQELVNPNSDTMLVTKID